MASVIILIGVPASGKSRLAEQMLRASNQTSHQNSSSLTFGQSKIISPDRIRARLYGSDTIQGDWSEIWAQIQQEFTNAAKSQQSVILAYYPPTLSEGFDRILFRDQKSENEWID